LDDAALRARLGEGGRARAARLFSVDAMASATLELYRSLLGSERRPSERALTTA
jgi:glycosyltransferase involved in cell wall biosynthesis